jgi:hypothetical protein
MLAFSVPIAAKAVISCELWLKSDHRPGSAETVASNVAICIAVPVIVPLSPALASFGQALHLAGPHPNNRG